MKFLQKYVLVPKEDWEKVNPHLKNQKKLDIVREKKKVHLPKVVKNNSQKVVKNMSQVKNYPVKKKNSQVKETTLKNQNVVQVGKNLQKNIQKQKKVLKKKLNRINQKKKKKVYRSLKSFIPTIKKEEKEYVKLLILFINKNKDNIKWHSKGEFYYKNQKVLNSNIGKLIKHSISNMKSQPVGMTKFYKMLAVLGVPEYLILNEKGKAIVDKYLKQKNYTWRPPGNLNAEY